MTSALVGCVGVLALIWGLVVLVRAWPWSPDQLDPSELRSRDGAARMALLPIVVLLVLTALVSLALLGWSARPPGWERFLEALPILAVGAASGLGVAACLLTMAGRRVGSWWLLTGLIPAGWAAALVLGA